MPLDIAIAPLADNQPNPLRFAIVGCGRMGRVHARRLHADGRGRVVVPFDSHQSAATQLRDELGLDLWIEAANQEGPILSVAQPVFDFTDAILRSSRSGQLERVDRPSPDG